MAAVVIDFAVRNAIDGVVGPGSWLVIGTVGPFLVGAMAVGTGHGVSEQVVVAASWQAILHRIVVVGVIVLDHGGATAVAALEIGGLRFEHDLLAGGIGHRGAATGIRGRCIVGVGTGEHSRGIIAGATVHLLTEQHATQKVLVIGHGRVLALGAVVVVHRQVIGRADRPDLCKALVLGVVVVLKVCIVLWKPIVSHTILVTIVLIGVTPGAAAAIGSGLGQAVVAIGGSGRLHETQKLLSVPSVVMLVTTCSAQARSSGWA